ncbi:MAG: carboxypeptidase regulatory-like domain-containing protein [Candidatus Riflebacteria bacterium]|nr:carboxypeptidase regulatory-like domain-containing protein [Candidatus Riflebacteria bacterium]
MNKIVSSMLLVFLTLFSIINHISLQASPFDESGSPVIETVPANDSQSAPAPIPQKPFTHPEKDEAFIHGTVKDSRTKQPIPGAMIVLLQPDINPKQWMENGSDRSIFAVARSGQDGRFVLNSVVPVNQKYPRLVAASGYRVIIDFEYSFDKTIYDTDVYYMNILLERLK